MCVARSSGVRCGPIVGLDVCGVVDSVSCLGRLATGGARDMGAAPSEEAAQRATPRPDKESNESNSTRGLELPRVNTRACACIVVLCVLLRAEDGFFDDIRVRAA